MATEVEESRNRGWVEFAAVVMFAIAVLRIITAIAYFAHSQRIDNVTKGLFGSHFWIWGVWDIVISAAAIGAGISLLAGREYGRVFGYLWSILVIVQGFTVLRHAPAYGTLSIVLAVLVIYGLTRSEYD